MKKADFTIEREINCDILVVGGGTAGIAAAVCAARHGSNVILAELNGYLGGTATAGLVGPFMTSYSVDGKTQLIRGFFDEFVRRMEQEGGAVHPSNATLGTSYTAYRTEGHQNLAAFDSECFKRVAEAMCVESGVHLMYHLMLIGADVESRKIKTAYFASKNGIYRINAKAFIDCSGDGDLAHYCGLPMIIGDGKGEVQPASLFFTVKGVDKEQMDRHMFAAPDMETKYYMNEIVEERENGNYPLYRNKIMLFEGMNGEWIVNMSQIDNVDATLPESVTEAEIIGRQQIQYILNFLRKYAAGCKDIMLVKSASNLGIRESRRIIGEYIISQEDVIKSVKFEDSVFCCSNSMDIHRKGNVNYIARNSNDPYYFPYRSLVASGMDNLLVAGRCASAEREVMAAIRVMPPCMAMGQAAGVAASIAVKEEIVMKEVDGKTLSQQLIAEGVYIA